jgi:hypothetical protein
MLPSIKINNRAACCPVTKRPLFVQKTTRSKEESWVQTYKNCITTTLIVAKETNEVIGFALMVKYLKYQQEDALADTGTSIFLGEGYKPLLMPANTDTKMHCAGTAAGGLDSVSSIFDHIFILFCHDERKTKVNVSFGILVSCIERFSKRICMTYLLNNNPLLIVSFH